MSRPNGKKLDSALASACNQRQQRLRQTFAANGIDALLISAEKDIQYLTGFVGHDSLALITAETGSGGGIIISDARYDEYLDPWRNANAATIVMGTRHRLFESVRDLCKQKSIRKLGIQADHVTLASRARLAQTVSQPTLVETTGLLSGLRMRKDELEIAAIERALAIQQAALTAALNEFTFGMTELEFSARVEFEMKSRGANGGASFTPIIGAGSNSSIIHHSTGNTPITPDSGVLLVDWGANVDGYCGDLTRTFAAGRMPAKLRDVYNIVLEAQLAAIEAIAPGKVCADIDAIARNVITKAGHGQHFGHGLGHGLGMDVHEQPYFNDLETQTVLQPGMVMTVEPGIYIPGLGGVRIEDDVLITGDGCRVLSDYPKDFDSATLEPAMSGST